ncbi:MAG: hybrid sensor histidine kinase/response regulator [Deltaproteobacteria bacterium]|nr:hybrid sensor histidine kinase/response regulator [Deltaproteobacteria bacterium]
MKILIVDDNKDGRYLLEKILQGYDYEIITAANGADALEKLRAQDFDMIIADILMPVMDGFVLCRKCKVDEKLKNIPFIFYTATYTDEKEEELALKIGADKFIRKPIDPGELIKIIRGVIRDIEKGKIDSRAPDLEDELNSFKLYRERLVNKLEKKMLDLERETADRKLAEEETKAHQEHFALINQILRHDLINELVVIQSALNLYNKSPEEEFLKEIFSRTKKSIELINRMRELESFISRHRELKMYEMRDTIDEVIKNYPSIDFDIKGNARIMADDSIASVIDNIVRNAATHGKADRITITTDKKREMCEVRIADNGSGIPDEIKKKVFEEGFMHEDSGHTGLGLHIVQKVMGNYGGYTWVEDNEPKGTVIALRFRMVK